MILINTGGVNTEMGSTLIGLINTGIGRILLQYMLGTQL